VLLTEQREVEDAACRFLRSLDYSGLAEVEFKYDRRDGRYKLLDVNARGWTWSALGPLAGVDFARSTSPALPVSVAAIARRLMPSPARRARDRRARVPAAIAPSHRRR
jgi:predicted ATP-grasp superfamily ATP-dependent carboligase